MVEIETRDDGSLWIGSGERALGHDCSRQTCKRTRVWACGFMVEPGYVGPMLAGACADRLEVSA